MYRLVDLLWSWLPIQSNSRYGNHLMLRSMLCVKKPILTSCCLGVFCRPFTMHLSPSWAPTVIPLSPRLLLSTMHTCTHHSASSWHSVLEQLVSVVVPGVLAMAVPAPTVPNGDCLTRLHWCCQCIALAVWSLF
jgi:hypothetical protein